MLVVSLLLVSIASIGLTLWSDVRLCDNRSQILPLLSEVVTAPCTPSDEFDNRTVYIDCQLDTRYTFYTPKEFSSNIYSYSGAFFDTRVEMYQWVERTGLLGVSKVGEFVDHAVVDYSLVDTLFSQARNPGFFPHVPGAGRKFAPKLKLGGYSVPAGAFVAVRGVKQLPLIDDKWYQPSALTYPLPVPHVDHVNTQVYENALYTGDPLNPKIGDLRITFWGNDTVRFSAIGRQKSTMFPADVSLEPISFKDENVILIGESGGSPQALATAFYSQHESTQVTYWLLRIMSVFLVAATLYLYYYSIKAPKSKTTLLLCSSLASAAALCLLETVIWIRYSYWIFFVLALLGCGLSCTVAWIWKINPGFAWKRTNENSFLGFYGPYDSVRWSTASPTASIALSSGRPLMDTLNI